ncbi:MAG: hypothetical protein ACF8R7_05000 [Phycisphaerales bacterium JB039]
MIAIWAPVAWVASATLAHGQVALEDHVARSLARITLLDLRMQQAPGPADYEIAALGLAESCRWSPDDEILLRKQIEARWAAGDEATGLALTRQLLKLDLRDGALDDEVSLLRVLSADAARLQTVEERLARYESLLERTDLPATVRSRIALDAALLLREQGEVKGFARMLARATALDATHKEAALLAATYYAEYSDDPVGRLEALLNVLLADPLDLNVHLSISRELSGAGAYQAARAFHSAASQLIAAGGQEIPEEVQLEGIALAWMIGGPKGLADQMEQPLVEQRAQLSDAITQRQAAGQPIDDLPTPSQILPTVPSARLRVLLAAAEGDSAGTTRALRDQAGAINAYINGLAQRVQDEQGAAELAIYLRQLVVELQAMRLITGEQVDVAKVELAGIEAELNGDEPPEWLARVSPAELELVQGTLRAAMALQRVYEGDWEQALSEAWTMRTMGPIAQVILAEAQARLGLNEDASATFAAMLERDRLSMWTAWARQRLLTLAPELARPPAVAEDLTIIARQTPGWVWRAVSDPSTFMALLLRAESLVEDPLDGGRLRLRIRNDSPAPIAMGPDRPINTRMLLSPKLEIGPRNAGPFAMPEVVNVDRRLRLNPRESIEVELWASAGVAGWFLESAATTTSRVRWRALQGFTLSQGGSYVPGPMCLVAETDLIRRDLVKETQLSANEMAARLRTDGEAALAVTCLAVRSVYVGPEARPIPEEIAAALVEVAAERYPKLSPAGRMAMVLALPNSEMNKNFAAFDAVARQETDPRVLCAVLLTRCTDPADPVFERAMADDDADVARLAQLLAERLRAGAGGTYARFRGLPTDRPPSVGGGGR